jgi:hypothetical protein
MPRPSTVVTETNRKRSNKSTHRRRQQRYRRLIIEPLEDRRVLSGVSPQGNWANVAMTDTGPVFQLFRQKLMDDGHDAAQEAVVGDDLPSGFRNSLGARLEQDSDVTETLVFSASFVGGREVAPVGLKGSETVFNYFIGDESNWRSGVPANEVVAYEGLYDGIDLHTWGLRSSLKYEFHVGPGADWSQIAVRYDGIQGLSLADDGSLLIDLGGDWGALIDATPYIYQVIDGQQVEVAGRFMLLGDWTYTFEITGEYEPEQVLVIDPDLAWTTYVGGSGQDTGFGIALDAAGNGLVTGYTNSTNFSGANNSLKGRWDTFVAKVSPDGALQWATYLGGSDDDQGLGIAVDAAGNGLVTGYTDSTNFSGANNSPKEHRDAFVAKVSPDGALQWATYLGGSGYDEPRGIAVDSAGNSLVTGRTYSTNFSGVNNSFKGGYEDAFLAKVSPNGTLQWATYLGGSSTDVGNGVAVDPAGNALVTGGTSSSNFSGAINSYKGDGDAFLALVSANGELEWATYLGGSGSDSGFGIAVDPTGNALVTGYTDSINFSERTNSYNGGHDAFVAKVSPAGAIQWATYLGGSGHDRGLGVAADVAGNALVTGRTSSINLSGTTNSYNGGASDAFVAKVSPAGAIEWATYLGGNASEYGQGIAVNAAGNAMVTGHTSSTDFFGANNTYKGGARDAFVAKIIGAGEPFDPVVDAINRFGQAAVDMIHHNVELFVGAFADGVVQLRPHWLDMVRDGIDFLVTIRGIVTADTNSFSGMVQLINGTASLVSFGIEAMRPKILTGELLQWVEDNKTNLESISGWDRTTIVSELRNAMWTEFVVGVDAWRRPYTLTEFLNVAVRNPLDQYASEVLATPLPEFATPAIVDYFDRLRYELNTVRGGMERIVSPVNDDYVRPVLGSMNAWAAGTRNLIEQLPGNRDRVVAWSLTAGNVGLAILGGAKLTLAANTLGISVMTEVVLGTAWTAAGMMNQVIKAPPQDIYWQSIDVGMQTSFYDAFKVSGVVDQALGYLRDQAARNWDALNVPADVIEEIPDSLEIHDVRIGRGEAGGVVQGSIQVQNLSSQAVPAQVELMIYGVRDGWFQYAVYPMMMAVSGVEWVPPGETAMLEFAPHLPPSDDLGFDYYQAYVWVGAGSALTKRNVGFAAVDFQVSRVGFFENLFKRSESSNVPEGSDVRYTHLAAADAVGTSIELGWAGSDLDLHVYDSEGRHVGMNYETGEMELQIPGAAFGGGLNPFEAIYLPNSGGQEYEIVVVGIEGKDRMPFVLTMTDVPFRPPTLRVWPDVVVESVDVAKNQALGFTLTVLEAGGHSDYSDLTVSISDLHGGDAVIPAEAFSLELSSSLVSAGDAVEIRGSAILPENLPKGIYTGTLSIGSEGIEVPVTVVVNQPPVIGQLTTDPESVTRPGEITLTAEGVIDPDGEVVRVEFYRGGEPLGVGIDGGDAWIWSGSTADWDLGKHEIFARAEDNEGAYSEWVSTTVTILNAPPVLTTIAPLAGAVSDEPFSISYAALMAASDASDPDGDAISFRVETVTSGVLTMNGEAVTPGETLLSAEETLGLDSCRTGRAVLWKRSPLSLGMASWHPVRPWPCRSSSIVR